MSQLTSQLDLLLKNGGARATVLAEVLSAILSHFHSETGTIHWLEAEKQLLHLSAQQGLPPQLLAVVGTIPVGKGIAGQVVAQSKPVTICNLQTDTSGVAKPGARQTGVGGTLGIGTKREHEYTAEETALLEEAGRLIGAQCRP